MLLSNSAEGGTNGTAVTTGNSGGGSGDAFNTSTGVNGTRVFDNTQSAHGSLSYKLINAVNTTNILAWTGISLAGTEVWWRVYVRFPSFTAEQVRRLSGFSAAS